MKSALLLLALLGSTSAQFSTSGQTAIVNAHNTLRSAIALGEYYAGDTLEPPSSAMLKMKWDTTVAASAQSYANTCPDDHSVNDYGENLYWSWSTAAPSSLDTYGTKACASWESEFQKYGWTSTVYDAETEATGIGHATQMAWGTTGKIGCGVKNCGKDASKKNMYKVVVVCQYSEAGNMEDADIYPPGDTCTFCPSKTKCESATGLCV